MATSKTTVLHLPAVGGMDQKTAAEWLDPEQRLALVTDGNFVKIGAVDKRIGIGHIAPANGSIVSTKGTRLASWSRQSLVQLTSGLERSVIDGFATEYSPATGAVSPLGFLPSPAVTRRPISPAPTFLPPILCDVPVSGGTLRLSVSVGPANSSGNSQVYAEAFDPNTGDTLVLPTVIYTATSSSTVFPIAAMYLPNAAPGNQVVILIQDNTPSGAGSAFCSLYGITFQQTPAMGFSGATKLAPSGISSPLPTGNQVYDACPWVNHPNGYFVIAFQDAGGASYDYAIYSPTSFTMIQEGGVASIAATYTQCQSIYVVANYGASEQICFYYSWSKVNIVTSAVTVDAHVTTLKGDGTYAVVNANINIATVSSNPLTPRLVPPVRYNVASFYLGWIVQQGGGANQFFTWNGEMGTVTAGAFAISAPLPLGTYPAARPFTVNGSQYQIYIPSIFCLYDPNPNVSSTHSEQGSLYLLKPVQSSGVVGGNTGYVGHLPYASVAVRQVDLNTVYAMEGLTAGFFPSSSAVGASRFAVSIRTLPSSVAGALAPFTHPSPNWAVDFRWDASAQANLYQTSEYASELHVTGAVPFLSDGASLYEDNFFYYPEFPYATASGVAGVLNGAYIYAIVYTYPDAAGNLQRSVPMFTNTVNPANKKVTVSIPALTMTWRDMYYQGAVIAEIYRTQASGSTYFLVDRISVSGSQTMTYITFTDNVADSAIATGSILYTSGGIIDNPNPPALTYQCVHKNRLFGVDETLRTIWFTQQQQQGIQPSWNEALTFSVPDGGDITALAELDDKLIIFKATSIWVVYGGDGPNVLAQGSDLTTPQRIASDVGCTAWQSVCLFPGGLLFQASGGIYLLDRSLSVSFLGKAMVDTTKAYPVVVGSALVPSTSHVRFALNKADGSASTLIFYDYLLDQWGQHLPSQLSAPIASICVNQAGLLSILTSDGRLWQEKTSSSSTQYMDDDSSGTAHFVSTVVTWPWVKQQAQGYQQCRIVQLFGERLDDCALGFSLAINYDPTAVSQATGFVSTQLTDIRNNLINFKPPGCYSKQMAIQVSVADGVGANTTTGQGCRFVSLAIELDRIGPRFTQIPVQRQA